MIEPTIGAVGVVGCGSITTFAVAVDVQPISFVTVNVYVLAVKPVNVALDPLPVNVDPPGDAVIVQFPAGRPEKSTLPVATAHVGCVIVPTAGVVGVPGAAFSTAFAELVETHPLAFSTVKV